MNDKKVTDLSQKMLEAYYRVSEENTPDLWDRVEKGIDTEFSLLSKEAKSKKTGKIMFRNIAAAAAVLAIIAIPTVIFVNRLGNSRDKSADTNSDSVYSNKIVQETMEDDYYAETAQAESVEIVYDERVLLAEGELIDFDVENYTVNYRIDKILDNEYSEHDIKKGTVIHINNPMRIYVMDNAFVFWQIEFDSLYVDENGEYYARIKELSVY